MAASNRPDRIFEAVKEVVAATGVLTGKTRRALDCTILDDAVATQGTVTQLIGAIRRVRREVPGPPRPSPPTALPMITTIRGNRRSPGTPRLPESSWSMRWSATHRVLGQLPEQELDPKPADAVALIAGQDVEPVEGSDGTDGRWRIAQRVASDRVISTVDPDARHAHKSVQRRQDGVKAHIAIEPATGIITDCALTKAGGAGSGDAAVGIELRAGESEPVRVLADSAYGSGDLRAELVAGGHVDVVNPHQHARQCRAGSPSMTSPSITPHAPRPALPGSPETSAAAGSRPSARRAGAALCETDAPPASLGRP